MSSTAEHAAAPPIWHAVGPQDALDHLGSGLRGLTDEEAARRLVVHGPNELEEDPPPTRLSTLLNQFRSPLITILLLAALLTLVLEEYIDSAVIAAVLVLNASIGYVQERRAEQSVRSLMRLVAPSATVARDGRDVELDGRLLVPGDLVVLESGDRVPADLRLITATSLAIDESLLTGESVPVHKGVDAVEAGADLADRRGMAFTGSIVARGRGRGVVVATGRETELGEIARHLRGEQLMQSPLQERMARFAHLVGAVIGTAALVTFVLGLLLGEAAGDMFLVAVALAVAAVPEGLPVVLTIALALGVRRMAHRNAIIRRLPAVETLGSTTLIGSDKTGTLTENRMTVLAVWAGGERLAFDGETTPAELLAPGSDVPDPGADPLALTFLAGVLANESHLHLHPDRFETVGDPTETALLVSAARWGLDPGEAADAYPAVAEIPFESERGWSASIRSHGGRHLLFVKGAPERVLAMCERVDATPGRPAPDHAAVREEAQQMAARGLRVLGMAYRELAGPDEHLGDTTDPTGCTFLGLQGMQDPPRRGVREAIAGCQAAGVRVVMITGDHAATARAIALDLGIVDTPDAPVLDGRALDGLDDDELRRQLKLVAVFARVSPEHKLRVVRVAQAAGDVVAVTGDGVNDAPALRAADIGIAMGRSGTDVAREAADMVLTDDDFVSIFAAVEEGRVTFDNVRKVTFFLVSTGVAALLVIPTAMVLGLPLPLLPAQLLWLNLVTNGLQDVALAFEPGEPGVLDRPPRRRREPVVSRLLWERAAVAGATMAAATLLLYQWALEAGEGQQYARTAALTTLVVAMAFHVGSSRSEHRSVFRTDPLGNRFLALAQVGALALHAASLHLGPTQYVLRVEPLRPVTWLAVVAAASTVLFAVELHKLLRRDDVAPHQGKVTSTG
jgi:magnesium-transporting ATPase (P-type)